MPAEPAAPAPRIRPLAEMPALAQRAAQLLAAPRSKVQLSPAEAAVVAARMGLVTFQPGTQLIKEGAESASGHMLLLLQGEVSVDSRAGGGALPLSVLGPGDIIGEMALIDGAPRSASCTAVSAVQAAGLSRQGLEQLMAEDAVIAAKLVVVIASRIAERLRGMAQQVQMYAQLAAERDDEVKRLRDER